VLTLTAPAFLAAGVLAAAVVVALHFLERRPPARLALPTARFVSGAPDSAVRPLPRPTDLLLLVVRVALLLAVALAFAGAAWTPGRAGTQRIILLEAGAMPAAAWTAALDSVQALLEAGGALVVFDSTAAFVPPANVPAVLDSLRRSGPPASVADPRVGLRALAGAAARVLGADSFDAVLVTAGDLRSWHGGTAAVRGAAWPGALRLVELPGTHAGTAPALPAMEFRVTAYDSATGSRLSAAAAALGWSADTGAGGRRVLLAGTGPDSTDLAAIADGALLVLPAEHTSALPAHAWSGAGAAPHVLPHELLFDASAALPLMTARRAGTPGPGARWLAVWEDGAPAAAAASHGSGAVIVTGFDLGALADAGTPVLPEVLALLVDATLSGLQPATGTEPIPFDDGARTVLRGAGGGAVAAGALAGGTGARPLERWLIALALSLAIVETLLRRRRRGGAAA
jgi:hypothetical protein